MRNDIKTEKEYDKEKEKLYVIELYARGFKDKEINKILSRKEELSKKTKNNHQ